MTATRTQTMITEPGVYDLPDAVYHADPVPGGSLSVSGARLLLPPSCPARYDYTRAHPEERAPKPEFDLGHAAHLAVLGAGPELVVVEAADWRTKAAREARADAHAAGRVPLLPHQHEQVTAMAAALRCHPIAGELLDPMRMDAEVSIFWHDPRFGVMRRARLDAVSRPDEHGAAVIVDYKSSRAADLQSISKALHNYGYAMQADWYRAGAIALGMVDPAWARFLFVFQEVEPPYLVTVVEPDETALRIGGERNRRAIEIYRDCTESGVWPGYTPADEIPLVSLPRWVEREHEQPESWEDIL